MKYIYLFWIAFGISTVSIHSVHAQQTFDSKKKKALSSSPSFQAKQIKGQGHSAARTSAMVLSSAQITRGRHKVISSGDNGLPSFIETKRNTAVSRAAVRKDFQTGSFDYLQELGDVLKVENASNEFVIDRVSKDQQNRSHVRLNQRYKNIPVYGAEVIIHLNEFGEGEAFNGKYHRFDKDINATPSLSGQSAVGLIKAHAASRSRIHELNDYEKELVEFAEPKITLCIYEDAGLTRSMVLAYHVIYCPSIHQRLEYFVEAHTGKILRHMNTVCHVDGPKTATANDLNGVSRTINTYQKGSTFFLLDVARPMFNGVITGLPDEPVGGILTIDMSNTFGDNSAFIHVTTTNNTWTNTKAVSAHFNAGVAYDYFRIKHGRNSIDGADGTIYSVINVSDPENGQPLDNAFWNGKLMFYGNGNVGFKPLAGSMDVAGHEMTHGVVQNTANLEYQGESGAINESMADIFGSMMDPADWLIGEDVVKLASFPSGALRSLEDPHNGGTNLSSPGFQPKHMNEKYNGSEDNGGVHINSGIPNHAFFKYATALTRDKAAQVFYKALNDYLSKSSQFIDLRLAVIKSAGDIFGAGSNEVTQAGIAFDAVGITNGQAGNFNQTLPTNPGTEYLLVTNAQAVASTTLFRIQVSNDAEASMSATKHISRPSVTDDGTAAVFVAEDKTIHALIMNPGQNPTEFVLQDEEIWGNVVISKGGSRIAAVTGDVNDNLIYVYDLISEEWAEFELYNPTFSDGIVSGGPLYADALEWDYSGEFLVYDAFNRVVNSNGNDIEYWDVNFMRVWDQSTQDFSDGTVEKLFASLPDGVSIGNPSFAKNSPNIIAFDYIDDNTDEYAILGCNVETNEVNFIADNDFLGYPTFNKTDTRVAFTSLGGGSTQTGYVVLNSDKISSNGNYIGLYAETKWPVYFAVGEREIGDVVVTGINDEQSKVSVTCYPNPFTDEISMAFANMKSPSEKVSIYNLVGQRLFDFKTERVSQDHISVKAAKLPPGQYVVRYQSGAKSAACKVVKLN